jgi:hypothetical protein
VLAAHPELIDLLIAPETLCAGGQAARQARADGRAPSVREEEAALRRQVRQALAKATSPTRRRRVLRRMTTQALLQIGTRFVLGLDGWPAAAAKLSRLGRASLAAAFEAIQDEHAKVAIVNGGRKPAGWAILGAGKLASNQLNFLSDLDLVLVSAAETPDELQRHTAAAQELISLFSDVTPDGVAWAIDVKLRPMGRNAPLVTTLDDITRYFAEVLDAWEFLAYARCRPVAGDEAVGAAAMEALARAYRGLAVRRFGASDESFVAAVRRMRDRLADSVRSGRATIETKRRHGGLIDLEFVFEMAIASCVAEGEPRGAATSPTITPAAGLPAPEREKDDEEEERDSVECVAPIQPRPADALAGAPTVTVAMPVRGMPLPGSSAVRARLADWLGEEPARRLRRNLTFLYRFEAIVRLLSGRREDSVARSDDRLEAITHGLGVARADESLADMLERIGHENVELFEAACVAAEAWFAARGPRAF